MSWGILHVYFQEFSIPCLMLSPVKLKTSLLVSYRIFQCSLLKCLSCWIGNKKITILLLLTWLFSLNFQTLAGFFSVGYKWKLCFLMDLVAVLAILWAVKVRHLSYIFVFVGSQQRLIHYWSIITEWVISLIFPSSYSYWLLTATVEWSISILKSM